MKPHGNSNNDMVYRQTFPATMKKQQTYTEKIPVMAAYNKVIFNWILFPLNLPNFTIYIFPIFPLKSFNLINQTYIDILKAGRGRRGCKL